MGQEFCPATGVTMEDGLVDIEAEEAVIGAILINPSIYSEISTILTEDGFYIYRNKIIWRAYTNLLKRRSAIDYITVCAELKDMKLLDEVGGASYLTSLIGRTPSSLNAVHYADIVNRQAIRRAIVLAANQIATLAYNHESADDTLISDSAKLLQSISKSRKGEPKLDQLAQHHKEEVERNAKTDDSQLGIKFGIPDLDKLLGLGLQKKFVILAGRPGVGKSSLSIQAAISCAEQGKIAAIFSFEMSADELMNVIISMKTGIDSQNLKIGRLTDEEWAVHRAAVEYVSTLKDRLFLFDCAGASLQYIKNKCLELQMSVGLDLVVIDYMMLVSDYVKLELNDRANALTRDLKLIKQELDIALIAIHHMNRSIEHRGDRTPQLSDLNEGGEKDPDIVAFLHPTKGEDIEQILKPITITFAKHRGGPEGKVDLYFKRHCTTFVQKVKEKTWTSIK